MRSLRVPPSSRDLKYTTEHSITRSYLIFDFQVLRFLYVFFQGRLNQVLQCSRYVTCGTDRTCATGKNVHHLNLESPDFFYNFLRTS